MIDHLNLVKIAFRKLKASVYFDKTALPLRDKVVAFEASPDFTEKLELIAQAFEYNALADDSALIETVLVSISALPFPKKMKTSVTDERSVINVGNPKEAAIIDEIQWFIDMDVLGHIVGILWIMAVGRKIDNDCYINARGNRLRQKLIWNEESELIQDSPALFEPYFAQYSLWRDDGLTCGEELLAHGHDALILTLDLKRFYYRTGISESKFNAIIAGTEQPENFSLDIKRLHTAVFQIITKYTEVLCNKNIDICGNVLPIGFLPSAVLSNWCLSGFDKGILDYWNPSYYGRYVDDIIIVEKIEKNSELYKKARTGELTKQYVINYYLGGVRFANAEKFAIDDKDNFNQNNNISYTNREDTPDKDFYRVNKNFCLTEDSKLEFQSDKTRIIMLFSDNNSTALINKFKQEIFENISAFRLMPEVGEAFSQDDFSQFYRLDNDATVNKLRGIKDIAIEKYELSKFLGKYRVVSSLVDDGNIKKFTRVIGKMFNDRELIDNYILWERVLEIFITDKDYKGFSKFVNRIIAAVESLTIVETFNPNNLTCDIIVEIKRSLIRHLTSSLNRVLSLLWGKEADDILSKLKNTDTLLLRQSYLQTQMSNKYIMCMPVENLKVPFNQTNINANLTSFTSVFEFARHDNHVSNANCDFLPYFRQAQDIAYTMIISELFKTGDSDTANDITHAYINEVKKTGNPPLTGKILEPKYIVDVGLPHHDKMRIAVANVSVSDVYNLDSVLKGRKPNRKYSRYKALANIVNTAIQEEANMLVLPENYIPLEWLPSLATKAAREQLAIVTGIEHIRINEKAYNYTAVILPFKYYDSIPTAAVFFQLKKHYSPEEKQLLNGYGFSTISGTEHHRPLYRWHDCYFPVYCCFELASINDRSEYMSWADMVVAVELNKDTNYFGSIIESLSRDLHCYCVQVNTSEYGDSRITRPTRSEERNLLTVKGGLNQTLLIGEIDISALREFQIKDYALQKGGFFKPTPPGFDNNVVKSKIRMSGSASND